MPTLSELVSEHRITLTLAAGEPDENFNQPGAHHFKATLHCGGRRMTVPFHTGAGWDKDPTAADVLDCLLSDANSAEESFEDWCADLGYDSDSRTAERTYKTCQSIRVRLQKLLGNLYDVCMYSER